jgi:hypothetical protein
MLSNSAGVIKFKPFSKHPYLLTCRESNNTNSPSVRDPTPIQTSTIIKYRGKEIMKRDWLVTITPGMSHSLSAKDFQKIETNIPRHRQTPTTPNQSKVTNTGSRASTTRANRSSATDTPKTLRSSRTCSLPQGIIMRRCGNRITQQVLLLVTRVPTPRGGPLLSHPIGQ